MSKHEITRNFFFFFLCEVEFKMPFHLQFPSSTATSGASTKTMNNFSKICHSKSSLIRRLQRQFSKNLPKTDNLIFLYE